MTTVLERRIREQLILAGIIKPGPKLRTVPKDVIRQRRREAHLVNPAAERALAIFRAAMERPMPQPKPKHRRRPRKARADLRDTFTRALCNELGVA